MNYINYRNRHHRVRTGLAAQAVALVWLPILSSVSCRQFASASGSDLATDEFLEDLSLSELLHAAEEWPSLSATDLQKFSQQFGQLPLLTDSAIEIAKSVKVDGEKLELAPEVIRLNETQMWQLQKKHPSTATYWKTLGFNPTNVSPAKIRTSIDVLVKYLRSETQIKQHTPPEKVANSVPPKFGLLGILSGAIEGLRTPDSLKNQAEESTRRVNWQELALVRPTLEFTANVLATVPGAQSQRIAAKLRVLNRVAPIIINSFEANDLRSKTVDDWSP